MTAKTKPDPNEQLTAAMVADELGIKRDTWWSYVSRRNGKAPPPDGREPLSKTPWWYRSTIDAYRGQRQGRGWRKGHTTSTTGGDGA